MSASCRICGRLALLPRSVQIVPCYSRPGIALYSGGFADVWMGNHRGRQVAVKDLRVDSTSTFDKITRVCQWCGYPSLLTGWP